MKKTIILLVFWALYAQNELLSQAKINVDSLTVVLDKYPKEDTVKVKMLIALGNELRNTTKKSEGFNFIEKAIAILEKTKEPHLFGDALYSKAAYLLQQGKYDEAINYLYKAIEINEQLKRKEQLGDCYVQLAFLFYRKSDREKAKKYYEEALVLSEAVGLIDIKLTALNGLGLVYTETSDINKSISFLETAIELAKKNKKLRAEARSLANNSKNYFLLGNYAKAIELQQKAITIQESIKEFNLASSSYSSLGTTYLGLAEYEKAINYFVKAQSMAKLSGNNYTETLMYQYIGACYAQFGKYEEAIKNMKKYQEIKREIGLIDEANFYLASLGDAYEGNGQKVEAHRCYQEAIIANRNSKNQVNLAGSLNKLATLYAQEPDSVITKMGVDVKERYSKALIHATEALEIGTKINAPMRIVESLKTISSLYENNKDYTLAYEFYKKYIALKDSIAGDDIKKQITRKEIQYEFDKKETELKYQQQLTAGELEKERLLTFQQGQALTLNRQNLILKEQALALSNKEKDLVHLAYLKEQAEKQEKAQELSLSQEREKGAARDLSLKNLELSAQQKQNLYLGLFSILLLGGLSTLLYFYNTLKKQKNIIAQQNELNEHTIAILSHDIKEPLLGVKLMLKKLNKEDPFVAQASQSLENQINSVNGILTNLLKMKKMALTKKDKNASANVKSVVQNVVQELSIAIQDKNLQINNELSDNLILPIASEKLHIIVNNLLSNAVKYSFPNQRIRIYQEGNGFSIQDFGIGLSPEQRSKIMREVTASQQGTNQERGNGLGLFLVGAMLQGEQVKVIFDSPKMGGTLVTVMS